ncbi:ABC transporter ATP-binding protein [Thermomonospora umbrina]|uniref:ATP-binding cassette subfamily C protein n=1 Tax=Thermomonospora umbrina TaxID=111806 RepID=A0A3D9SZK8_9ACTN|nr:ABC transporter ATP-binding protein [Thermomonospora umbrina]REF00001.1 ATP-binding cassette subfamily C protein [Thermomonospora umbrina]
MTVTDERVTEERADGERELLPVASAARTRAAVRELARPHRRTALGGFAALVTATAVGLLTAPVLGHVIDLVAQGRPASALTAPAVWLVAIAIVQGVTTAYGLGLVARAGEGMLATLRERFVERALGLPLEQVERAGSGDLTSRVTNDVSVITTVVREAVPALARSLLTIGLTLVAMAVLDWRFLLVALLAVPIQAHTVRWYVRRAVRLYAAQRVAIGAQQQDLLGAVGGASTVRAFRLEDEHTERVRTKSQAAVDLALRGVRLLTRFYSRLNLAEFVGLSAVLVTGFLLVRGDAVSIGTAGAAALYFHNLFAPINIALGLVDDAQSATAGLARLVGVADISAPADRAAEHEGPADGSVRVGGVGYSYRPGHPVLHDIDLHIAGRERVALVGASGAGKSTLARLIAGIHRPDGGEITVTADGSGDAWVALVTQEVHVFAGTLADDLRLARPTATDDALRDALDRVGALGWAEALPDGLDTVVGESGHRLTAAQAQQLALARLVLADPPVVVLDEATAEAGSAGARALETSAASAVEGRTALVVAHRLTQAATADRIVVLEEGRVAETGTHDELVRAGGRYAALWRAWSDGRDH